MCRCPHCGHGYVPRSGKPEPIEQIALRQLAADLEGCGDDCWRFFERLFAVDCPTSSKAICFELGVTSQTFLSRFFRAELPSPKRYLAMARLVRAAGFLEDERQTLEDVAVYLKASSQQAFNRSVREVLGMSAGQMRRVHTGESMLALFRAELITPHRAKLLRLRPMMAIAVSAGRVVTAA